MGIELAPRADAPGKRATEIFHSCFDTGLLVHAASEIIALSPRLIFGKAHIDEMVGRIGDLRDDQLITLGSHGVTAISIRRRTVTRLP